MPSPYRRMVYRYRRWQYHREMALPTPAPHTPHTGRHRMRRTVHSVTHPVGSARRTYERKREAKPPAPPRTQAQLAGGPLKRTYVRTRIGWSRFWHGVPSWPIAFQALAMLLVGAIVGGAAVGIYHVTKSKHPTPNLLAEFGQSNTFYADAAAATKAGVARVLLAGDLSVFNTAGAVSNDFTGGAVHVVGYTDAGCGISDGDAVVDSKAVPRDPACKDWPKNFATTVSQYKPKVSVLMTGTTEEFEQVVDGKHLKPGSRAWQAYLTGQLDTARVALTGGGAKMILVNLPCDQKPDGDLLRADVDALWRVYADAHRSSVVLGDLNGVMCPGGHIKALGRKPLLDAHANLTAEGYFVFWHWLPTLAHTVATRA